MPLAYELQIRPLISDGTDESANAFGGSKRAILKGVVCSASSFIFAVEARRFYDANSFPCARGGGSARPGLCLRLPVCLLSFLSSYLTYGPDPAMVTKLIFRRERFRATWCIVCTLWLSFSLFFYFSFLVHVSLISMLYYFSFAINFLLNCSNSTLYIIVYYYKRLSYFSGFYFSCLSNFCIFSFPLYYTIC